MVVDDEPDLLATTRMMLKLQGFSVHGFMNPEEALSHVKGGCTDCILLLSDVRMPSMSGIELVQRVKNLRPGMKVILMTAYEINQVKSQIVLPVDGFLGKPFSLPELINAVEKACCSS
jgi:DNA-binding NtrC family response regulator